MINHSVFFPWNLKRYIPCLLNSIKQDISFNMFQFSIFNDAVVHVNIHSNYAINHAMIKIMSGKYVLRPFEV